MLSPLCDGLNPAHRTVRRCSLAAPEFAHGMYPGWFLNLETFARIAESANDG